MAATSFSGVRRATLADVAAVARLSVNASREAERDFPSLLSAVEFSAPELALRLLEDLDDGNSLYVAEREGRVVGFAEITGLMVGDGGHLVELRRLYVAPQMRRHGLGRQLLKLILHDLGRRSNPPALRAWAAAGSATASFFESTQAVPARHRWKVGAGGLAVRGTVYSWAARPSTAVRNRALAT
jgi:GNAT superfamily N-acetyltransferase